MQTGQTVMVIIEKQNSPKSNITGGGKQTEFLISYKPHKITMVNIIFNYGCVALPDTNSEKNFYTNSAKFFLLKIA